MKAAARPAPRPPSRVFLLDDHRVFRDSLYSYLQESDGLQVVGSDRRGPAAYTHIAALQPAVVVVDPGPRLEDVAPTLAQVRQAAPEAALIALSFCSDDDFAAAARQAGAEACIDKLAAADGLHLALQWVSARA